MQVGDGGWDLLLPKESGSRQKKGSGIEASFSLGKGARDASSAPRHAPASGRAVKLLPAAPTRLLTLAAMERRGSGTPPPDTSVGRQQGPPNPQDPQ